MSEEADFDHDAPTHLDAPSLNMLTLSLGTQAMVHLGERPLPGTETLTVDLGQAKYTIDLLQMLHDKTVGNRTEDEDRVFERLLYDLRMKYVARSANA